MSWIPLVAWLAAVLIAAAVLGFCAYEIIWRARRLRGALQILQGLGHELSQLQSEAAAAQRRLARSGAR